MHAGNNHPVPALFTRIHEALEVPITSDKGLLLSEKRILTLAFFRCSSIETAEHAQDLVADRPQLGTTPQKRHAERPQRLREPLDTRSQVRGFPELLGAENRDGVSRERKLTAESFVKHHAHGVPVARLCEHGAGSLFRRHVGDRSGNRGVGGGERTRAVPLSHRFPRASPAPLDDETKIQDNDAAIVANQHVAGLQIAVELALEVKGGPLPRAGRSRR